MYLLLSNSDFQYIAIQCTSITRLRYCTSIKDAYERIQLHTMNGQITLPDGSNWVEVGEVQQLPCQRCVTVEQLKQVRLDRKLERMLEKELKSC